MTKGWFLQQAMAFTVPRPIEPNENIEELEVFCKKEWAKIPQTGIENL